MTAFMTILTLFYEEIMTVFCTDNMTNNIQYGVTSHCDGAGLSRDLSASELACEP